MPETETESKKKSKKAPITVSRVMEWAGMGSGALILILAAWAVIWFAMHIPGQTWRTCDQPLPWKGDGITVEEAAAEWKSSVGDARLSLRTALYPTCRIKLGECTGKGALQVIFKDSSGHQVGDTCRMPYENGAFRTRQDIGVKAEGKEATCYIETGFKGSGYYPGKEFPMDDYLLHQISQEQPLWRAEVYNVPSDTYEVELIGFISIPVDQDAAPGAREKEEPEASTPAAPARKDAPEPAAPATLLPDAGSPDGTDDTFNIMDSNNVTL